MSGKTLEITLSGDWRVRDGALEPGAAAQILTSGATALSFDCGTLGHWDSALIAFLASLRAQAAERGIALDTNGLPPTALQLLDLCVPAAQVEVVKPSSFVVRVGQTTLDAGHELIATTALIGSTVLRGGAVLGGRAMMRTADVIDCMREAGPAALVIVTIINVLVGAILAFVGAVQLRRFGADIYVASLVGIAMVREMAALMTAIIMAGRTGGAYAANLATMQGNEELDALNAVGIPIFDYLVLPRIIALTAMMPILYLWGCAVGIIGGYLVASATLNLSAISYFQEVRNSVALSEFGLGLAKSLAFGALIAILACRVGLRAGRSAADVGRAATTGVVAGVIGVIALDAGFDVCANILDI
jgi:phospholipid/cholesterol/gamma-HCH transport system permease protein